MVTVSVLTLWGIAGTVFWIAQGGTAETVSEITRGGTAGTVPGITQGGTAGTDTAGGATNGRIGTVST